MCVCFFNGTWCLNCKAKIQISSNKTRQMPPIHVFVQIQLSPQELFIFVAVWGHSKSGTMDIIVSPMYFRFLDAAGCPGLFIRVGYKE